VVHVETHIHSVLTATASKIRLSGDRADSDDVFPSRSLDDLRVVPLADGAYDAPLPPALVPGTPAEAATAASAQEIAGLTRGVVGDVWLLSHAQYLVGTCLSQVSRLAAELAFAGGRARAAPVGVDAALCRAFPMPAPYAVLADWRATFDVWLGDE
jgi:hypothetical protein